DAVLEAAHHAALGDDGAVGKNGGVVGGVEQAEAVALRPKAFGRPLLEDAENVVKEHTALADGVDAVLEKIGMAFKGDAVAGAEDGGVAGGLERVVDEEEAIDVVWQAGGRQERRGGGVGGPKDD